MKDRALILADHPIEVFLERQGIVVKGSGQKRTTNRCPSEEHKPNHQCVSIDCEKGLWRCHACDQGGTVIDFLTLSTGCSVGDAMRQLGGDEESPFAMLAASRAPMSSSAQRQTTPPAEKGPGKIVKTYDYTDANGKMLYQVVRMDPKDFRQRRPDGQGGWIWKLGDTRKVLYNLPAVKAATFVWITEGEKDADTIGSIGFCGTSNVAGATNWEDSYSQTLKGKDVLICGDNDDKGRKHVAKVQDTLAGLAKTVTIIEIPPEFKDVTEYRESFETLNDFKQALLALADKAECLVGGVRVPIFSMDEMEREYEEFAKSVETHALSLGKWLPALGNTIRPLVPGELVTILADTGVGKTMLLQNLAISLKTRLTTLIFEMELPKTLTFERFIGMEMGLSGQEVLNAYRENRKGDVDWRKKQNLGHIHVCPESRLTVERIEEIVNKAGLKLGQRPQLVMIDYIQLLQGSGSRYERLSAAAEELKILAKSTNTIVIVSSQVGRKDRKESEKKPAQGNEVFLHDAKDSGSIENSSGLVLGAWRDPASRFDLMLKVCKNTKGISGARTTCRIGSDMRLTEIESSFVPGI